MLQGVCVLCVYNSLHICARLLPHEFHVDIHVIKVQWVPLFTMLLIHVRLSGNAIRKCGGQVCQSMKNVVISTFSLHRAAFLVQTRCVLCVSVFVGVCV